MIGKSREFRAQGDEGKVIMKMLFSFHRWGRQNFGNGPTKSVALEDIPPCRNKHRQPRNDHLHITLGRPDEVGSSWDILRWEFRKLRQMNWMDTVEKKLAIVTGHEQLSGYLNYINISLWSGPGNPERGIYHWSKNTVTSWPSLYLSALFWHVPRFQMFLNHDTGTYRWVVFRHLSLPVVCT